MSIFFTAVIRAVSAVCHASVYSAFSDLADIAVTKMLPIFRTAIAVDLIRFENAPVFLRPYCGYFLSFDVIIFMCSYEGYAV